MRGTIAVHASQTLSRPYYEAALEEIKKISPDVHVPTYDAMVRGAIVGLVEVVGCEEHTKSKWRVRDHYGFLLANPRVLSEIPRRLRLFGMTNKASSRTDSRGLVRFGRV